MLNAQDKYFTRLDVKGKPPVAYAETKLALARVSKSFGELKRILQRRIKTHFLCDAFLYVLRKSGEVTLGFVRIIYLH